MHTVTVYMENGDVRTYHNVKDVNHWQSALVELTFEDGSTRLIRNFNDVEVAENPEGTDTVLKEV